MVKTSLEIMLKSPPASTGKLLCLWINGRRNHRIAAKEHNISAVGAIRQR